MSNPQPLRFGIMCRGLTLDAWQADAVAKLVESGNAQPALVIIDDRAGDSTLSRSAGRLFAPNLFWRLFIRFSRPQAQRSVDVAPLFDGVDRLHCRVIPSGRFGETFSAADVEQIESYRLDFVLRFGFGIIRGDVLTAARYGIWSFHHGDELRYRGGPPCFWEMYNGDPVVGAILQRLTDRLDSGIVLRKGYLRTVPYSYARSVDQLFFETADWPAYVAAEIRNGITERAEASPSLSKAPIYRAPSNAAVLKFLWILLKNAWHRFRERKQEDEWNVGVAPLRIDDVLRGRPLRDVRWMNPVANGWLADPIALGDNGVVHVLCERMDRTSGRAHICSSTFDGTQWTAPTRAIDPGTHASYPYAFRHGDRIYCIPETYEANAVKLYAARDFPSSWEYVATLLDGIAAVDSTVFEYDGLLWLFCTTRQASATRLYAYYANDLLGPWQPHPCNPVKIDVRGSRPAGPPFVHDGVLYRPAQDSSRTYGGRVVIHRVVKLSPKAFLEEPAQYVEPDPNGPYREGLHTLCFADGYCVIDGRRRAG